MSTSHFIQHRQASLFVLVLSGVLSAAGLISNLWLHLPALNVLCYAGLMVCVYTAVGLANAKCPSCHKPFGNNRDLLNKSCHHCNYSIDQR